MKLKKIDRRMNGYGKFKYCINFNYVTVQDFCDVRRWCSEQWGASDDFEFLEKIKEPNTVWCWVNDQYTMRIYIATDKEAQWFILKWGDK
jgi:hypothetical protein